MQGQRYIENVFVRFYMKQLDQFLNTDYLFCCVAADLQELQQARAPGVHEQQDGARVRVLPRQDRLRRHQVAHVARRPRPLPHQAQGQVQRAAGRSPSALILCSLALYYNNTYILQT